MNATRARPPREVADRGRGLPPEQRAAAAFIGGASRASASGLGDDVPLRPRPRHPHVGRRPRHLPLHGGSEPDAGTRLSPVPISDRGPRRRPHLRALQPLPGVRLRVDQGCHVALRRRHDRAVVRGAVPVAGVLRRRRGGRLARPSPARGGRLGGACGNPAVVLLVPCALLERRGAPGRTLGPVRRDAGLSRHGRVRDRGPIQAARGEDVRGAAGGLARLRAAAAVRRLRAGGGAAAPGQACGPPPVDAGPRRFSVRLGGSRRQLHERIRGARR